MGISMKIYALANELNLDRKIVNQIVIPFGTWDYGEKQMEDGRTVFFRQTLNQDGAWAIADQIAASVAKGEKGVPVYWGHPDVPELAHKYPDKRAKGWIKFAKVYADGLHLSVEWLEENATEGFGWFSPYWTGPVKETGDGQAMMTVNALASVALVNMPNIQEFRLANELQDTKQERPYHMNQQLIEELAAKRDGILLADEVNFDESKHPRADDGRFSSGGGVRATKVRGFEETIEDRKLTKKELGDQIERIKNGIIEHPYSPSSIQEAKKRDTMSWITGQKSDREYAQSTAYFNKRNMGLIEELERRYSSMH